MISKNNAYKSKIWGQPNSRYALLLSACVLPSEVLSDPILVNGTTFVVPSGTVITTTGGSVSQAGLHGINSAIITADNITISTSGTYAHGIYMESGSVATISNSAVTTAANSTYGIDANGLGSNINISNSNITTKGNISYAVRVLNSASTTVTDTIITTEGNGAYGLEVTGNNSRLYASGVKVDTYGTFHEEVNSSVGAVAEGGAQLYLNNSADEISTIVTHGKQSAAVMAQSTGHFIAEGDDRYIIIQTTGDKSRAALVTSTSGATSFSQMDLTRVDIHTSGDESHGVASIGNFAAADLSSIIVRTSGNDPMEF